MQIDKRTWTPGYHANRGAQAMGILQAEIVRTGYRCRDARRAGMALHFNACRAQLFALLKVRRAMRAANIEGE